MSATHTVVVAMALLLAVGSAWQVNLWPLSGSGSESAALSALPPLQCGDVLIVSPYENGGVFAVNLTEKTLLWGKGFAGIMQMATVPASNAVVIGVSDFMFAYDVTTGKRLWMSDLYAPASSILVNGDTIIFINQPAANPAVPVGLIGISAKTSALVFNTFQGGISGNLVALTGGMGGMLDEMGTFHAFSLTTGKQAWTVSSNSTIFPIMRLVTAGEGYVLLANTTVYGDREVLILNAATGATLHKLRAMSGVASNGGARILNGYFYAPAQGALQVYQLSTGYMVWALPTSSGEISLATEFIVVSQQISGVFSYLIANISNGDIVNQISGLPSSPSGAFALVGNTLAVLNLQGFVCVNLRTGAVVYRNEDMPGVQASSLLAIGNDLVWSSGTAVYGITF